MKNMKYIGIFSLLLFSFFYVHQIANLSISNNSLYRKIEKISHEEVVKYVNAEISGNKIVPGLSGKSIDVKRSYYKMFPSGTYDKHKLIYDVIKPNISIENNKDKIIVKGNSFKNQISIIVDNDMIYNYMNNNQIKGDILVTHNTIKKDSYLEQINNDIDQYNKTESILRKYQLDNELCIVNSLIEESCRAHKKYLIQSSEELDNRNIVKLKRNVVSGSIYYVKPEAPLDDFLILLKEIRFKNIDIVYLSELIKE